MAGYWVIIKIIFLLFECTREILTKSTDRPVMPVGRQGAWQAAVADKSGYCTCDVTSVNTRTCTTPCCRTNGKWVSVRQRP